MPASARTYLYVPADRPELPAKAARSAADALILDLEDAVPAASKELARDHAARQLATVDPDRNWWVRVNADLLEEDLTAVVGQGLRGIVLPGAEPELAARAARILEDRERAAGLAPGSVGIIGLLETARGIAACAEVARAPRMTRLGLGEADLAADLGIQPSADRVELWSIRACVVVQSVANGLPNPIGPVEQNVHDGAALTASTRLLLRQGFAARTVIHPGQLETIHRLMGPSAADVAAARALVERFEEASRTGRAVAVAEDGQFIDAAVLRSARRVLASAERADTARVPGADSEA